MITSTLTSTKTETTTLYRADNYDNDMGDLIGFFLTLEEAKAECEFRNRVNYAEGDFSEITSFEVPTELFNQANINSKSDMILVWMDMSAEIQESYFFIK